MKKDLAVSAKKLKVHTGEVLNSVAEGAVVYVTMRDKIIARLSPATEPRDLEEVTALDALIAELHGSLHETLPSSISFARTKQAEERLRSRR